MLHDCICGSFHNTATINASALLCELWQNLDEDGFDMLYNNDCWAAIPDPIWTTNVPYERKINMLSSTDNNFMIVFLILRDSVLNLGFLFLFFFTHTVYAPMLIEMRTQIFPLMTVSQEVYRTYWPKSWGWGYASPTFEGGGWPVQIYPPHFSRMFGCINKQPEVQKLWRSCCHYQDIYDWISAFDKP